MKMSEYHEDLTEQERIFAVSGLIAIASLVYEKYPEIADESASVSIYSKETSRVTGIPIDIVNKALENLEENGDITVEEIMEDNPEE